MQKIIIITGTIASGKSTALKILRDKFAYYIISADEVYHKLLNEGAFDEALKREFPNCFNNSILNKTLLRERILTSRRKRRKLNDITHIIILEKIKSLIKENSDKNIAIEIPLQEKIGLLKGYMHYSIFVTAPVHERLLRLAERNWAINDTIRIVKIQKKYERHNCDFTINNDGDEAELEKKLQKIINDFI